MTISITHAWTCDVCGTSIGEAETGTYRAHGAFPEPSAPVAQWRPRGCCYDLCETCASRMNDLFVKLAKAAWAEREAEAAQA